MKTQKDITAKIQELESEIEDMQEEFETRLEDEGWDEDSSQAQKLQEELDWQKEIVEKQIKILNWVLEKIK